MLNRGSSSGSGNNNSSRRSRRSDATRELFGALEQSPPSADLIRPLLEAFPRTARQKDAFDNYPLHTACSHGASLEIIQMLVEAYPTALRLVGSEEDYPLHLAAIVGAPMEVLSYLGNKWPAAFLAPNRRQSRPLHLICARTPTMETLQYMLSKGGSAALKTKDHNRDLPLHVACKHGASLQVVKVLVKKYPDAMLAANSRGDLPLHVALTAGAPLNLIKWLLERAPRAASTPNIHGDTPLHLAASNKDSSTKLLSLLLVQQGTVSLSIRNHSGDVPLHKAIACKASYEVIDLLIHHDSGAALQIPNKRGWLPLHTACQQAAVIDIAVIIRLVEVWPVAVASRTKNGSIPLHFACNHKNALLDVITFLVSNWPANDDHEEQQDQQEAEIDQDFQGINVATTAGDTPLHYCCYQQTPRAIIRYLLSICPQAIIALNKDGKTPLDRARRPYRDTHSRSTVNWLTKKFHQQFLLALEKATPSSNSTIMTHDLRQLIRTHPDLCCHRVDDQGLLALHHAVLAPQPVLSVVKELVAAWPEALTHTTTGDRNTALHLACKSLRNLPSSVSNHTAQVEELTAIIKYLANTDTVRIKNADDALALHILAAARKTTSCLEALQCLVKIWPGSMFEMDGAAFTPLQYAQQAGVEDVLKWLSKRKRHEDRFLAYHNGSSIPSDSDVTNAAAGAGRSNSFTSPRSVAFLNPIMSPPRSFRGNGSTLSGPARRLGFGGAEEQ